MRGIGVIVGGSLLGLAVVVVVGMRAQSPMILGLVRRVNRALLNPMQMRTAGTPGAYAHVIRHVGRRSGDLHETPIVAEPTADGFVIAVPYGRTADWVANVLAAGAATIVREGEVVDVDRPELVSMASVERSFGEADRRAHRRFGSDMRSSCAEPNRFPRTGRPHRWYPADP